MPSVPGGDVLGELQPGGRVPVGRGQDHRPVERAQEQQTGEAEGKSGGLVVIGHLYVFLYLRMRRGKVLHEAGSNPTFYTSIPFHRLLERFPLSK